MTTTPLRRRGAALAAALLSAALALTACGTSSDDNDQNASNSSGSGDFPVTVESSFGPITVEEKPETIVSLSPGLVDVLSAIDEHAILGNPVDEEGLLEFAPWVEGLYSEYDHSLVTAEYEPSPEAIAAQDPDLIIIDRSVIIDEQIYEQLSQIAPVYVAEYSSDFDDYDYITDLGAVTGKVEQAKETIADLNAQFAEARERLAGLQGRTFNAAYHLPATSELRLTGGYDWVEGLGLVVADNQPATGAKALILSQENLDQFNGEVATILTDDDGQAALESDPRFAELPSVQNGALLWLDSPLGSTMTGWNGPTGLRWLLERILPQLEGSELNESGQ